MKNSTLRTGVLIFGIALFMTTNSYGQSQGRQERMAPPTFKELLKEMDKDEDGKLSKEELKGPLKEDFAKVDLDEDGFITEKEFDKAPKPKRREN